jgi:tRNA A37 threonylcarbamoyladenosine synthetase subunit TsaC/SUA5/YrdC
LTDIEEIRERLETKVDLIIEGGTVGVELTTVIDLTSAVPVLLRRGKGEIGHFGIAEFEEN